MKQVNELVLWAKSFLRKHWVSSTVVLVILGGVLVYGFWSQSVWSSYRAQYANFQSEIATDFDRIFALKADTSQERKAKLADFDTLVAKLSVAEESLCRLNDSVGWQRVLSEPQKHEKDCKKIATSALSVRDELKITIEYLKNERTLTEYLGEVIALPANVSEIDWNTHVTVWRDLTEKIKVMTAVKEFEPVKQLASEAAAATFNAWTSVVTAHEAKNKAAYLKATQELTLTYDALGVIGQKSSEQLDVCLAELQTVYQKSTE